jgi:hypothetical protein
MSRRSILCARERVCYVSIEIFNFLLTAAGTSRIVAKNDLHSPCSVPRRGLLQLLHLLRLL